MSLDDLVKAQQPITDYTGFALAIGSVFAVRHFRVDKQGRLLAINYGHIWKPGENVAKCRKDEGGFVWYMPRLSFTLTDPTGTVTVDAEKPLHEQATDARITVEHSVPVLSCSCGFYAFAEGCDDESYGKKRHKRRDETVLGVVECYGRTILGTKGLRFEKGRVVALHRAPKRTQQLYPDVKHYRSLHWMLRRHDVIQPLVRTPETDPNFWGAS